MTPSQQHGSHVRELTLESIGASAANGDPGKFGRMFPHLPPLQVDDAKLLDLAQSMLDAAPSDPGGDNPDIPAGFTYLGQFVDHDITLDTTPLEAQRADPMGTTNFRTPALDLDSVYGQGPGVSPHLYARGPLHSRMQPDLLLGTAAASADFSGGQIPALKNDLPRNSVGRALIGDERNDENLLVAQIHVTFLKFHNAVLKRLRRTRPDLDPEGQPIFEEARRLVTWHYQWIVLFEFVEKLTEPGLINRIRQAGRRFYRFKSTPYMPVEFSAAAYRLGHSMVREGYSHNRVFRPGGPGGVATLGLLFHFTGKSGGIVGDLLDDPAFQPPPGGVPPFRTLPSNWVIDWRRFFDLGTPPGTPGFEFNLSRRIDPFLVPALHTLPGLPPPAAVLPFRNLRRGVLLGLPSGQAVAHAMRVPALHPDQIATGADGAVARRHGLDGATPLWYYVLKEAEQLHQGRRLGPVGSTIVAETFLGLVHGDHRSFLWRRSNWSPELPSATPGTFTMADMIRFIDAELGGHIDPVG